MQCGENCKEWHQIVVNLTKDRVKKVSFCYSCMIDNNEQLI